MNNIIFSASDAGGANSIVPIIKEFIKSEARTMCVIGNQAKGIFERAEISFLDANSMSENELKALIEKFNPDVFVAGSSLGESIDKKILLWCRLHSVKSIYVLDFWANYWQRFSDETKNFRFLPDYICVMDNLARQEMIQEGFSAERIVVTGNPHFDHFTDNIRRAGKNSNKILFISQPLRDLCASGTIERYGYDEHEVLNDVLEAMQTALLNFQLVIRLHPKEDKNKFDAIVKENPARTVFDLYDSVEESLSQTDFIIGMNSIVLFQAAVAGKTVISYQPNLKRGDPLISNRLGLSELIMDKDSLRTRMERYFNNPNYKNNFTMTNNIIKQATQNVMDFLSSFLCMK